MSFGYYITVEWKPEQILQSVRDDASEGVREIGAGIRRNARALLKYSPRPSRPGQPPNVHRGRKQPVSPLRDLTLFGMVDDLTVVVGPAMSAGKPTMAARVLQEGGTTTSADGKRFKVEARPFMRPAMFQELMKVPSIFGQN